MHSYLQPFLPNLEKMMLTSQSSSAQRWFDNSFDLQAFGYNWTATGPFEGIAKADIETVTQPVGTVFTTLDNIGSYPIATTNVADPAVVNGQIDVSERFLCTSKDSNTKC
jgi:hypothetical protein